MKGRSVFFRVTALFYGLLFLLVVADGAAAEGPIYGGTLRWHEGANPPQIDPHKATDTVSARVVYCLFETLVANSADGQTIEPLLAESWRASADGLTWTFKLRPGVHFHEAIEGGKPTENAGREVTAEDWKWSFERMIRNKSPRAFFVDCIKGYREMADGRADEWSGIRALDRYTLEFTLEEPFAPFLSVMAHNAFVVVPREDAEKWGANFGFHPVGTGPFVFEEWRQDQYLSMVKNPVYWRKDEAGRQLPYLDGLRLSVIPDSTVAWEEFKAGNLDMMKDVPDHLVLEARRLFDKGMLEAPTPATYFYGFNNLRGPFAGNRVLRQAFNYAVDREAINELVLEGLFFPAKGVLPPSMPGYNPNLRGYSYDPAKAGALLEEAGYARGFECTLQVNQDKRHQAVAEAVQAQLAMVGVKMNIRVVDWGVHLDTLDRGEAEFFRLGLAVDYLDPDSFLYANLHSSNFGERGNQAFYKNDDVDRRLAEARVETDQEARMTLYREAEQQIVEDAPWLFLFHYSNNIAAHPFVRGVTLPAFGNFTFRMDKVWMTRK